MQSLDLNILKTITTDNVKGMEFAYSYSPDFFEEKAKLFAKLLINYMLSFKSVPTRRTFLEWHGHVYGDYINEVWDKLDEINYDIKEYNYDLEKIKKRYINKTLNDINEYLDNNNSDKSVEQKVKDVASLVQKVRSIQEGKSFKQQTVAEHMEEFESRYEANVETEEPVDVIKTHYSAIDHAIDGFLPAEFFVIGAETGGGKSLMLNNVAKQMWMQNNTIDMGSCDFTKGYNITYFSLEMPYEDCFSRFLACLAQVPQRHILNSTLSSDDREKVEKAKRFIEEYPYQFDIVDIPRGFTVDELELRYKDALLKYQPQIVIIDYMGLMHSPEHSRDQDWLKMGFLAGELHEFGRAYKVVMGSALQLTDIQRGSKGNVKKKEDAPLVGHHRIGRSSQILHNVNLCIQIETRYAEETYADLRYHIIKNRKGPLLSASLIKDLEKSTLTDIPYIPNSPASSASTDNIEGSDNSSLDGDRLPDISDRLKQVRNKISNLNLRSQL